MKSVKIITRVSYQKSSSAEPLRLFSLLRNASKKLKQNLVTSLTFDFNFIMFEQARHLYLTNYSSLLSFLLSGFKVMSYTAISC